MGILDSIIRYRELENLERQTNQQSIRNVFSIFQQARQTSLLAEMEKKRLSVDLARSGLRFGAGGRIEADPNLIEKLGLEREWKPTTKEEALEFEETKTELKRKESATKEVKKYQELAAKEGWTLEIDPNLPPIQQARKARQLYTAKKGISPKEPTWTQEQKKAAIKSGIARGHVVIGKEWGEPEEFDIKSRADVYRAIELGGYDPTDPYWQDSLAKYPASKIGDIVERGGKKYEVVGIDEDGVPLVNPVR